MSDVTFATSTRWLRRILAVLAASALLIFTTALPAGADVSFINSQRAAAGLAPMSSHAGLAAVARAHSVAMADRGGLFHTRSLGAAVGSVISNWQGVGENVGVARSLAEVNAMFMRSSSHRANIMGNFNRAGVGVYTGPDGRVWVTQTFARVAQAAAPAPAPVRTVAPRVSRSAPRPVAPPPPAPEPPAPPPPPAAVAGIANPGGGYRIVAEDGGVFTSGDAAFAGSAVELGLSEPIVGGATTPSGNGYLLFGARGGVFTFGDARYFGSAAETPLNEPVVAGSLSPSGEGYVLFAKDGGAMAFGDASYEGGAVGQPLNAPIVSGARSSSGRGYWLAGSDGGVYAFGDAPFFGSLAEAGGLAAPIVGIVPTASGQGYWLVGADGGVFAFGDAPFLGSTADNRPPVPVRGLIPALTGRGYWLLRSDRDVIAFGAVDGPILRRPDMGPAILLR